MYHHDVGRHKLKRAFRRWLVAAVLLLVGLAAALYWFVRDTNEVVQDEEKITSVVASTKDNTAVVWDQDEFSIALPEGWELKAETKTPYLWYNWRDEYSTQGTRTLNIWVDSIAGDQSMNHIIPVSAKDNQLDVGELSDDCRDFTTQTQTETSQTALAKWQGVEFTCDLGDYQRNSIGIGSLDGLHKVTVTGASGVKRDIFILYTDQSLRPNPSVILDVLGSLRVK